MKNENNEKTNNGYELIEADEGMHKTAVDAFSEYMDIVNKSGAGDKFELPSPEMSASKLMAITADRFRKHNKGLPEEEWWPIPTELIPHQIALLVLVHHKVRRLPWVEDPEIPFEERLFVYQTEGPKKGLYTTGVSKLIEEFEPGIEVEKKLLVVDWLTEVAEKGALCTRGDLVAVNNGIFNCRLGVLMPFSPEYIFLTKIHQDFIPAVQSTQFHKTRLETRPVGGIGGGN